MIANSKDKEIIRNTIKGNVNKLKHKDIYIFGCTIYARDIRDELVNLGIRLTGFIDNNAAKSGKTCLGVKVQMPEQALLPYKDNALVIICSKYADEMISQLKTFGYHQGNMLAIEVSEVNTSTLDSIEEAERSYSHIQNGVLCYEKIKKMYPDVESVFLCPYPGTGDIYMACVYLPQYIQEHRIRDYVVVVSKQLCKRVCSIFDIDQVCVIESGDMENLLAAWEFAGELLKDIKPLLHWGWRCKRYLYSDNHPAVTFNELFKYDVFGLNENAKRIDPLCKKTCNIKDFFKTAELNDRIIILSPYAGSFVSEIKWSTWCAVAEILTKMGYKLFTNCQIGKEETVPGTEAIFFPIEDGIYCLNAVEGMIALRSGLCDVVSSADTKMVVLYEEGFNASRYEFFSMVRMGLRDIHNTYEYVYDGNDESLMHKIVGCF